jgi:hypothetical protein
MIEENLAQCRQLLSRVEDDVWTFGCKRYYQLAGAHHSEWINDCFFAAGGAVHRSTDLQREEFIERLSEYNKLLQKHNIDLILVRIPGKGDLAASVFMSDKEYIPNPDWLKFQIACLSNDIEVIDPLPEMWKKRFDYPLFYFFHEAKEYHPQTGTSYVTAEILAEILRRYEENTASESIYTLQNSQYTGNLPCKYYYPDGNVYDGDWVDGDRTGKGTFTWKDGSWYTGDFVDSKMTGKGERYYASYGTRYVGDFVDGKRHGYGTYYYADGTTWTGKWENDTRVD